MGKRLVTVGSITREQAAAQLPFLAARYGGRRNAIREITHTQPDLVFWISPEGRFIDAREAHLANPPKGFEHILHDEPRYGGFLRGRVAWYGEQQFVVVYVPADSLVEGSAVTQFASGFRGFPVPVDAGALVISDNGDLYGTVDDVLARSWADDDDDPDPDPAEARGVRALG
jgi:hypothetical protein